MAFAQGSRSSLSYINEVTFGTTPAGNFNALPFTTHSLSLSKARVQGNDIQSDRMPRHDRHGNRSVGGDIVVDLRSQVYDDLIASAMFNPWTAGTGVPDTIKVGTTLRSMSIEDYAADIDQSLVYTGCVVSQAAFSLKPNQMVTSTFTLVGKDQTAPSATQKTITAAANNAPMDSYTGSLEIGDSGGATSASSIITGIDFSINNNVAPTFVVGSASTPQLEYGLAMVEGTITAYFENVDFLNRFLNETETAIEVNCVSGSSTYTFLFPRVKINGGATPVGGPTSRMITAPFVALYDTTEATNLKISRPEANT